MLEQQMIGSVTRLLKQLAQIAKEPLLANDKLSLDVIVNNLIEKDACWRLPFIPKGKFHRASRKLSLTMPLVAVSGKNKNTLQ